MGAFIPLAERRIRVRLLIAIGLLNVFGAASEAHAAGTILFVGNSFTYGELSPVRRFQPQTVTDLNHENVGGVPALFKAFTTEAHLEFNVSLETSPGKGFDFHFNQKAAVLDRAWDHVILQGYSTLDKDKPGDPAMMIDYTGRLARMFQARNSQVDVRLVATWSRADQTYLPVGHWYGKPIETMAMDVRAGYNLAAATSPVIHAVIPVGEAWNRAVKTGLAVANPYEATPPGRIDLWAIDNYHASTYGYYLEALLIFGNVTGKDPRSLGSGETAAVALNVDAALAVRLQQIAFDTLAAERTARSGW
jgi:hypothetical protein